MIMTILILIVIIHIYISTGNDDNDDSKGVDGDGPCISNYDDQYCNGYNNNEQEITIMQFKQY